MSTQRPGMSLHVISYTSVSTTSDKCWGEKAWVRGQASTSLHSVFSRDLILEGKNGGIACL